MRHTQVAVLFMVISSVVYFYIYTWDLQITHIHHSRTIVIHNDTKPGQHNSSLKSDSLTDWKSTRQTLLSNFDRKLKVLFFSYMRGGSSIGGEMFNSDPRVTLWYEPLDSFYSAYYGFEKEMIPVHLLYHQNGSRRALPKEEHLNLVDFIRNQLSCNFQELPSEALSHYFLSQSASLNTYTRCYKRLSGDDKVHNRYDDCKNILKNICGHHIDSAVNNNCDYYIKIAGNILMKLGSHNVSDVELSERMMKESSHMNPNKWKLNLFVKHTLCMQNIRDELISPCIDKAVKSCKHSSMAIVELNRIKMEDVEHMIKVIPDIHIVYFMRDPRAIINSRLHTKELKWNLKDKHHVTEARFFCPRVNADWIYFQRLSSKYPGALQLVRYEDMVEHPTLAADIMFSRFNSNLSSSKEWAKFAEESMHSNRGSNGGGFGINVKNPYFIAYKWKREIPSDELKSIEKLCSTVLIGADYQTNRKTD